MVAPEKVCSCISLRTSLSTHCVYSLLFYIVCIDFAFSSCHCESNPPHCHQSNDLTRCTKILSWCWVHNLRHEHRSIPGEHHFVFLSWEANVSKTERKGGTEMMMETVPMKTSILVCTLISKLGIPSMCVASPLHHWGISTIPIPTTHCCYSPPTTKCPPRIFLVQ